MKGIGVGAVLFLTVSIAVGQTGRGVLAGTVTQ
jgi:hypothetical protein